MELIYNFIKQCYASSEVQSIHNTPLKNHCDDNNIITLNQQNLENKAVHGFEEQIQLVI